MRYTVAAVQYEPRFADKPHNVAALLELTRQAARAGARLVVLPEMGTTGYCFANRNEVAPLVERVPDGPTVMAFASVAAEYGVHVVVGLPEVEPETGAYYNTAVLIGPEGYVGKYRKTHSYIDETRWARDGDLGIPVFDTALGRVAMLICMDLTYFETARVAGLTGADIVAFPTNWLGVQTAWRARAMENGVYVVAANRWGEERGTRFCGRSAVIDPYGVDLSLLAGGDGLALAQVDTEVATRARKEALSRRRPERYQEMLISSYLWHWRTRRLPEGRPITVAACQANQGFAAQLRRAAAAASANGWPALDLAVLPALEEAPPAAALAAEFGCAVVWGEGRMAVRLVGPNGLEARAEQGELVTLDLPWGRLGLLTGEDLWLPEPMRILAKRGADLVAVPARWEDLYSRLLWAERADGNDTALAVANGLGGSAIYQPVRPRVAQASGPDEAALLQIDLRNEDLRSKEYLRMLQPRWYDPLVKA